MVELVRGEHAMLGAVIKDARPVALEGFDLTLAFSATAQFLRKKAEDPANRAIVGRGSAFARARPLAAVIRAARRTRRRGR